MKKIVPFLLIVGFVMFTATSCKKKGDPPALPSLTSFTINLGYFETTKSLSKGVEDNYFEVASGIVTTWIPIIETTLATPIAACEALSGYGTGDAKWIEQNTWKWSYTSSGSSVEAVAVIGSSNISWTVTIGDFQWVTGSSNIDGTSGTWNINESSDSPSKILQIDWVASGTSVTSIKYTCSSGDYSGNSMTYTPTATGTDYNSSLSGTHNSASYNIEWHSSTKIGRIKCQTEFGDTEWRLWNANNENI